jgi:hypothetical protein
MCGIVKEAMDPSAAHPVPAVPPLNSTRRRVLLAIGAGGAGAAATAAVPGVAAVAAAAPVQARCSASGYRVSDHVRTYYQSARR